MYVRIYGMPFHNLLFTQRVNKTRHSRHDHFADLVAKQLNRKITGKGLIRGSINACPATADIIVDFVRSEIYAQWLIADGRYYCFKRP